MDSLISDAAMALMCGIEGNRTACQDFLSLASMLMTSPDCPTVTEPTVMLLKSLSLQSEDPDIKRAALALAVARYVDLLGTIGQVASMPRSVSSVCSKFSCPEELVDLRHKIVHKELPSLSSLEQGGTLALEHVVGIFWAHFVDDSINTFRLDFEREFEAILNLLFDLRFSFQLSAFENQHIVEMLTNTYFSSLMKRPMTGSQTKFEAFWKVWRRETYPQLDEKIKRLHKWMNSKEAELTPLISLIKNFLFYLNFDDTLESLLMKFLIFNLLVESPQAFLDQLMHDCIEQLRLLLKSKTAEETEKLFNDHRVWCSNHGGKFPANSCFCITNSIPAVANMISWMKFLINPEPHHNPTVAEPQNKHDETDTTAVSAVTAAPLDMNSTVTIVIMLSQRPQALLQLCNNGADSQWSEGETDFLRIIENAAYELQSRVCQSLHRHFEALSKLYVDFISRKDTDPEFTKQQLQEDIWTILCITQSQRFEGQRAFLLKEIVY